MACNGNSLRYLGNTADRQLTPWYEKPCEYPTAEPLGADHFSNAVSGDSSTDLFQRYYQSKALAEHGRHPRLPYELSVTTISHGDPPKETCLEKLLSVLGDYRFRFTLNFCSDRILANRKHFALWKPNCHGSRNVRQSDFHHLWNRLAFCGVGILQLELCGKQTNRPQSRLDRLGTDLATWAGRRLSAVSLPERKAIPGKPIGVTVESMIEASRW